MNIFILAMFLCNYGMVGSSSCFWNSYPYRYYSTRTPYNVIRGDIRDSVVKFKDCEPISIWGVFRHGKRYPSKDFGIHMKKALILRDYLAVSSTKGNSSMCAQDVENLLKWEIDDNLFKNLIQHLSPEGIEEVKSIAKRYREAYSTFFDNIEYEDYTIRPANTRWVKETAAGFVEGLGFNFTIENPRNSNDIMAPYQVCPKYIKGVKKNQATFSQAYNYVKTEEYRQMKTRVEKRLGLNFPLTYKNITAIEDICTYSSNGVENKPSPWCALLAPEDLKVIEYYGDLRNYYRNAYGLATSQSYGGTVLRDLLLRFQEVKEGKGKKLYAYFTHAAMMEMIYTALGLFKDESPLTYIHRDPNRKFRSSKSTGYGVNFVAVLNRCIYKKSVNHNVVLYLNEEPIKDLCNYGDCTWKQFEDLLTPFSNYTIESLDCEYENNL